MPKFYARVVGGVVVETFTTDEDIATLFPPGYFQECSADVRQGFRMLGGALTPPIAAPVRRVISSNDFLALFTPTQQAALFLADPLLLSGALRVLAQGSANLDSPEAAQLLSLAVAKGVLTEPEKARVLAGIPPSSGATTS